MAIYFLSLFINTKPLHALCIIKTTNLLIKERYYSTSFQINIENLETLNIYISCWIQCLELNLIQETRPLCKFLRERFFIWRLKYYHSSGGRKERFFFVTIPLWRCWKNYSFPPIITKQSFNLFSSLVTVIT